MHIYIYILKLQNINMLQKNKQVPFLIFLLLSQRSFWPRHNSFPHLLYSLCKVDFLLNSLLREKVIAWAKKNEESIWHNKNIAEERRGQNKGERAEWVVPSETHIFSEPEWN